jgi:hypothetical protein
MSHRIRLRAIPALIAAYALALQVALLALACPLANGPAFAAPPICSHANSGGPAPAPSLPCCDGLGACLAGCCAAPALHASGAAVISRPGSSQAIPVLLSLARPYYPRALAAHRSRAPPLG